MPTIYTTVTSKGQITLPADLRKRFGIQPGHRVGIREVGGTITLEPIKTIAEARIAARREIEAADTIGAAAEVSAGWRDAAAHRALKA